MRMKWKLPVCFGALVLGLTATVVGCSKDSTAPQGSAAHPAQQKTSESQDSYKRAGKYHTEGLAYVYSKLAQTNKRSTKAEKCRVAIAALKEFDRAYRNGKSSGFVSDDVCGLVDATGDLPAFGEQSVPSYVNSGFSPQAASMLDEIRNVGSHSSSASVASTVTRVQNSAAAKLNPAEAGAVTALGSVAISSAEYWEANADKWRGLSSAPGVIRKQIITTGTEGAKPGGFLARPRASLSADCCGGIATADITAFISAILQGWFAGIFDLEQAAMRATVASIVAGFKYLM